MNRSCQRQTQVFDLPVRRMISLVPTPSALERMIAARQACFCEALRSLVIASSRPRTDRVIVMEIPVRMRQTRTATETEESQSGLFCQTKTTRCQSAGWILLIHAGEFVARLAHYMQHLVSDHIRKYAAELCRMAVFGTLNPLTPARLQA